VTNAVFCLARNRRYSKRPSEPRSGVRLRSPKWMEDAQLAVALGSLPGMTENNAALSL
jgi:hypothetical protein